MSLRNGGPALGTAEYVVSAARLRKSMADAIWFVVAAALIDFLEELHELHYLPSIFNVY
jgi:hypothetical protein